MKKMSNKKTPIDFTKVITVEDFNEAMESIKGVGSLLHAKELVEDIGTFKDNKHAYYSLRLALDYGLKELEGLSQGIEYMNSLIINQEREQELLK